MKKITRMVLALFIATLIIVACKKEEESAISYSIDITNPYTHDIEVNGGSICSDNDTRCKIIVAGQTKSFTGKAENSGDEVIRYASYVGTLSLLGHPGIFNPTSGGRYTWTAGRGLVDDNL